MSGSDFNLMVRNYTDAYHVYYALYHYQHFQILNLQYNTPTRRLIIK